MAMMEPSQIINAGQAVSLVGGEYVRVQILNADGTVKTTIYNACVPDGKVAAGTIGFYATLVNA